MPTVINGVGTWYYGKRDIHQRRVVCEFCQRLGELESYDTTLYFVVVFVPIIPLGGRRILDRCPYCSKHRVVKLKAWKESKEKDVAAVIERLEKNPSDPEAQKQGLAAAAAYQDGPLLNELASAIVEDHPRDPELLSALGDAQAYFARWENAEVSFRSALAVKDAPEIRGALAHALLKQGKPEEAEKYLAHILDDKRQEDAGLLDLLVEGYQAEGKHQDALRILDSRDAAFPDLAGTPDAKAKRKLSLKNLESGKKIASAYLAKEFPRSRVPRYLLLGAVVGAIVLYFGSALWIGQFRKVSFFNGTNTPYLVLINGQEYSLKPGGPTHVRVPEGKVAVQISHRGFPQEPAEYEVETPFFTRPFASHTFVFNPDQCAIFFWQEMHYALPGQAPAGKQEAYLGKPMYAFDHIDFAFEPFPDTIEVKGNAEAIKRGLALATGLPEMTRLAFVMQQLNEQDQAAYARRRLTLEPNATLLLQLYISRLDPEEALAFLRPTLADKPVRPEWHRLYQYLMESKHPEVDLRPEYRKLAEETHDAPDALYLFAHTLDGAECDDLLQRAAKAKPPSVYAIQSLGFRALAEAKFNDAVKYFDDANRFGSDDIQVKMLYLSALLGAKQYDRLLKELQQIRPMIGDAFEAKERIRALVARGDRVGPTQAIMDALRQVPPGLTLTKYRATLQAELACAQGNRQVYLRESAAAGDPPSFWSCFLKGEYTDAAKHAADTKGVNEAVPRGLLYLKAAKAKDQKQAEENLKLLQQALEKGGKEDHLIGAVLAGRQKPDAAVLLRLPMRPDEKCVLLAAVVRRFPDQGPQLLPLIRRLNFQRDLVSLCLREVSD